MALNDGFRNRIFVQAESTVGGSTTGTLYELTGKVSFVCVPVLDGILKDVDVWRFDSQESFSKIHWQGEFVCEYFHNDLTKLLVDSFLSLFQTQADTPSVGLTTYSYRPPRLDAISSFKISVDYNDAGPFYSYKGCVIDSVTLSVSRREFLRLRVAFKALDRTTDGGEHSSGSSKTDTTIITHLDAVSKLNNVTMSNLSEMAITLRNPVQPVRFGTDKKPTRYSRAGRFEMVGDLVEFFEATSIDTLVTALTEDDLRFTLTLPTTSKKIEVFWPRVVFKSGTPDAVARTEISYRASFTGKQDTDLDTSSEPTITLVK